MTMVTATYPLAGSQSCEAASTAPAGLRAWGFLATLGWFAVAVATCFVAEIVWIVGYLAWWTVTHPDAAPDLNSPVAEYLATVVLTPAIAALLALAARRAGWSARDYLGLVVPRARYVLIGFGLLAAFWLLEPAFEYAFPSLDDGVMQSEYHAVIGNGSALVLYWLTLVVTAPVAEEIIFRGFLFRGFSESRLGAVGALILTSLIFAAIHTQYNVAGMIEVFGFGLLLGLLRWRSGSTLLTIFMHAAWNLTAGAAVALSV